MPPMKKAPVRADEEPKQDGLKMYRIVTDRMPVWDDVRRKKNELIRGPENDPGILLMLEREWIKEVRDDG